MVPGWKDEEVHPTLMRKALTFIERHAENRSEQPFFLYLPLTGPHTPWLPNPEFQGKSGIGPRGDLILQIDDSVGQLMNLLEEKGIRDGTMIVFTSDNGPDPFRDELTMYGHAPVGRSAARRRTYGREVIAFHILQAGRNAFRKERSARNYCV